MMHSKGRYCRRHVAPIIPTEDEENSNNEHDTEPLLPENQEPGTSHGSVNQ